MMYLRLHENGPEFPIGHDLLLGLARALKRRTSYPDLVTALLELRIPSLTKELLGARALETGQGQPAFVRCRDAMVSVRQGCSRA